MTKINVQLQHQQVTLNMKALRYGLTRWGNYWAHQERGQGFASLSQCPDIERLATQCIRAIRAHYICKGQWALMEFDSKKSYLYWLRRAEIEIVSPASPRF